MIDELNEMANCALCKRLDVKINFHKIGDLLLCASYYCAPIDGFRE